MDIASDIIFFLATALPELSLSFEPQVGYVAHSIQEDVSISLQNNAHSHAQLIKCKQFWQLANQESVILSLLKRKL